MSSFAEARAVVRAGLALVSLLALATTSGCYRSDACGGEETCNYADDDCDHRYDEDFRDESGVYATPEHCGGCGVACADVFPTALETACDVEAEGAPRCVIVSCAPGFHLGGDGGCVPDVPVLCRACRRDFDCAVDLPGAACVLVDAGTGLGRCAAPCVEGACDAPLTCADLGFDVEVCVPPDEEFCACGQAPDGVTFGCLLTSPTGRVCAGEQTCMDGALTMCAPAADEDCNAEDDDCDGAIDESYRDDEGRYVDRLHCGGCALACAAPGPNMTATCLADDTRPGRARCDVVCEDGFVDVDRIAANGCECEKWDGTGPPPAAGGDGDCDGVVDDSSQFIYVTTTGSDANAGTLIAPLRTIQEGIARGAAQGKDVLVGRGIYEGPVSLADGVSVFGGYRPDFRDRDLELYPVVIEPAGAGEPTLVCRNLVQAQRFEGFTLEGSDAIVAGEGSTTVLLDGCGPAIVLADVVVLAGRGAPGARGASSAENLAQLGLPSLTALDGVDGTAGQPGTLNGTCTTIPAGVGGDKVCFGVATSGGDGGSAGCPAIACTNGQPCANAGCTDFTVGGVCDIDTVLALAVPNGLAQDGLGAAPGEAGEPTYNAPTNRGVCNFCDDNPTLARDGARGEDGADGTNGQPGEGCGLPPSIDFVTGRVRGGDGTDGTGGTNGSGGGGGSPGSGYEVIGGTAGGCADRAGGSGGGGGSGGCGAPLADGGRGGGASIGVLVRAVNGAGPTFERVRIVTASGGAGGDGGIGAAGGTPGVGAGGGAPRFWCARLGGRGGDGGSGGASGGGGGGCGGGSHAILVAASGTDVGAYVTSLTSGTQIDASGIAGRGGLGGFSPGVSGGAGGDGAASAIEVAP